MNNPRYQKTIEDLHFRGLEAEWRNNLSRYSILELKTIFGKELDKIVNNKILEYQQEYSKLFNSYDYLIVKASVFCSKKQKEMTIYSIEAIFNETLDDLQKKVNHILKFYFDTSNNTKKHNNFIDVNEILERINILDFIRQEFNDVRRIGADKYTIRCPFHDNKTPSLVVYAETNSFYCYGCSCGGNLIHFFMRYKNIGFKEALKDLSIM